jgi:hypothetical protein
MAFCTKCGTRFEAGTAFCGNCGTAVAATATPDMESPGSQQSGREIPVSDAPALGTFAATSKDHQPPRAVQPPPKAQPTKMGAKIAEFVFMCIIAVPFMFIFHIAWNWVRTGSLLIEMAHGFELRLLISIGVFVAFIKTIGD